uniref:Endoplasmic reticulum vesicle transporter C-terminal domain-containing protein n=1 Tax=Odontella aurita TaxID=265563 RepID=A0A6U6HM67_9STRA|mmetsp:Transcript_45968/g.139564  ORF Transcript_45968/g.139564 Transcript_45968/m.139564 type:complete len:439 (+) Transcript_45968:142-1458(+)
MRRSKVMRSLDMFPKVESDLTVKTDRGGMMALAGYGVIAVLLLAEVVSYRSENSSFKEHVRVDKSLGKRMRVDLNITFPALHCDDLHVDAMDVAGDSQIDVEDTLVKKRLHLDGRRLSSGEIKVETNKAAEADKKSRDISMKGLPEDYCGPCYGAHQTEDQCCNTCDDVVEAYKVKKWSDHGVLGVAEQCKREGRTKLEPKRMSKGEGCNLSGYMTFNRVAGNFHIAMGEGVERDGRHIHQFVPEDAPNFNASHTIHKLSFGPEFEVFGSTGTDKRGFARADLSGVSKIVTEVNGNTGLFQYFIKVVPTNFVGKDLENIETNRYFFTERYRPLMIDMVDEEHRDLGEHPKKAGVHTGGSAGGGGTTNHYEHHKVQNSVLPGVFFVYEIYPFAVEVSKNSVPLTHLLIRIMATVGGVMTIVGWLDSAMYVREKKRKGVR